MKPTQYTLTAVGEIPHWPYKHIVCPVKVYSKNGRILPVVRDDRYVYALPGGGEILGAWYE